MDMLRLIIDQQPTESVCAGSYGDVEDGSIFEGGAVPESGVELAET